MATVLKATYTTGLTQAGLSDRRFSLSLRTKVADLTQVETECARLIAIPELFIEARRAARVFLPAASVNKLCGEKKLSMHDNKISSNRENTHRPATNYAARRPTPSYSPSSQAMRWSLTNTQWRTASISRSHYKPFAWIGQRVF